MRLCHICSVTNARENRLKLVKTLPVNQQNQLLHSMVKEKVVNTDGEVKISTQGKSARIALNPVKTDSTVNFTAEKAENFKVHTGVSTNFMSTMTNFIRAEAGRKSQVFKEKLHLYNQETFRNYINIKVMNLMLMAEAEKQDPLLDRLRKKNLV